MTAVGQKDERFNRAQRPVRYNIGPAELSEAKFDVAEKLGEHESDNTFFSLCNPGDDRRKHGLGSVVNTAKALDT